MLSMVAVSLLPLLEAVSLDEALEAFLRNLGGSLSRLIKFTPKGDWFNLLSIEAAVFHSSLCYTKSQAPCFWLLIRWFHFMLA